MNNKQLGIALAQKLDEIENSNDMTMNEFLEEQDVKKKDQNDIKIRKVLIEYKKYKKKEKTLNSQLKKALKKNLNDVIPISMGMIALDDIVKIAKDTALKILLSYGN